MISKCLWELCEFSCSIMDSMQILSLDDCFLIESNGFNKSMYDLETIFNVYDLIRAEYVKICGDASSFTSSKGYIDSTSN